MTTVMLVVGLATGVLLIRRADRTHEHGWAAVGLLIAFLAFGYWLVAT